ncbi:mediator-associated protein 2 [Diospyros lotus]|uniref:mediator-associated protein 2 n=1 Tax=Diospyros lotus TaxID=55363 RepID=UPI002258C823|nr:mediator-associated protein 2 [Diospyros lotus]
MDAYNEVGYKAPSEFQEDGRDSLIDLNLTNSAELWLIQWPINQAPDFDGQEISLKLHRDGQLGSFEGSSGKSYDVVSFRSQDPDATVFISSSTEAKIVGKISRRVSFVHYPEPSELQERNTNNQKQQQLLYQRSGTSLTTSSHQFTTPTRSIRPRNPQSGGSSSRYKRSLSEVGEPSSKPPKRRHDVEESTRSRGQSTQDSGRGHSIVTSSGSLERSNESKAKKRKKHE